MREMVERDIDMLRNEQGEILCQAEDFKAKFYKFIVDHYLRKFHCFFFLHLTLWHLLITIFAFWIQPNLRNPRPIPMVVEILEN